MADQWSQFQDAPADDFAGFRDAPAPRVSQPLGAFQGAIRPLDNAALALEGGLEKIGVPARGISRALGMPTAQDAVAQREGAIASKAAEGVIPGKIGDFVGSIAGTLPFTMAGPSSILTQGAIAGALNTTDRTPTGIAQSAALGAAGAKVGDALFGGLFRRAQGAQRPAVQAMRKSGVPLTPGQTFGGKYAVREDKLMSTPVVGEMIGEGRRQSVEGFNRGLINEALKPIGKRLPDNVETGFDAVGWAQRAVSKAYDDVVPNMSVQPDAQFVSAVNSVGQSLAGLPKDHVKEVQSFISGKLLPGGKVSSLDGKTLQTVRSSLSKNVQAFRKSQSPWDNRVADIYDDVLGALDDLIVRQNPSLAPRFEAANQAFRGQMLIDRAAKGADDGIFSTGQAKQAGLAMDASRRKAASARGEGFMQPYIQAGRQVIPAKAPNPSGTAGHLMQGNLFSTARGAMAAPRYNVERAMAEALAGADPRFARALGYAQRPAAGLFGAAAPALARPNQGY